MDLFSRSPDIHNGVSGHIECVVQLDREKSAGSIEAAGV